MRSRFTLLFLLAAISLMPLSIFAQTGNKLPKINIKEYRLKNGLFFIRTNRRPSSQSTSGTTSVRKMRHPDEPDSPTYSSI